MNIIQNVLLLALVVILVAGFYAWLSPTFEKITQVKKPEIIRISIEGVKPIYNDDELVGVRIYYHTTSKKYQKVPVTLIAKLGNQVISFQDILIEISPNKPKYIDLDLNSDFVLFLRKYLSDLNYRTNIKIEMLGPGLYSNIGSIELKPQPYLTVIPIFPKGTVDEHVDFKWELNKDALCTLYVDSSEYTVPCKKPTCYYYLWVPSGEHYWRVKCDTGDENFTTNLIYFKTTNSAPDVILYSPKDNDVLDNNVYVHFYVDMDSNCSIIVDDTSIKTLNDVNGDIETYINIPSGKHTFKIECEKNSVVGDSNEITIYVLYTKTITVYNNENFEIYDYQLYYYFDDSGSYNYKDLNFYQTYYQKYWKIINPSKRMVINDKNLISALIFSNVKITKEDGTIIKYEIIPKLCPEGWLYYNGSCYIIIPKNYFEDANNLCKRLGGHLVTISNKYENEFVRRIKNGSNSWIGLKQDPGATSPTDGWNWINGESLDYTNWNPGEPNDMDNSENHQEDYGEIYNSGYWNDIYDNYQVGVCEKEIDINFPDHVILILEDVDSNIFIYLDRNSYYSDYYMGKKYYPGTFADYYTAKQNCENLGYELPIIEQLYDISRIVDKNEIWINNNDLENEDEFIWYGFWNSGEPNNWNNIEDLTELYPSGLMNDIYYSNGATIEKNYYVCEEKINPCPNGWIFFNNSCYLRSNTTKTYNSAKTFCNNNGSHLVDINSPEEAIFLSLRFKDGWVNSGGFLKGGFIHSDDGYKHYAICEKELDFNIEEYSKKVTKKLPYIIESTDLTGAYIWIKIDYLKPGQNEIILKYGNPFYENDYNYSDVFDLYEDFNNYNARWFSYGNCSYDGTWLILTNNGGNCGIISKDYIQTFNRIIEFEYNISGSADGMTVGIIPSEHPYNIFGLPTGGDLGILKQSIGTYFVFDLYQNPGEPSTPYIGIKTVIKEEGISESTMDYKEVDFRNSTHKAKIKIKGNKVVFDAEVGNLTGNILLNPQRLKLFIAGTTGALTSTQKIKHLIVRKNANVTYS